MGTRHYRGIHACPACKGVHLEQRELHHVPLLACPTCSGVFVSVYHLAHFVGEEAADPAAGHAFLELLREALAHDLPDGAHLRRCPICKRRLQRFGFGEHPLSIVDRCAEHGLWLDDWDVEKIVRQCRITAQLDMMQEGDFDGDRDDDDHGVREGERKTRRATQAFVSARVCPNCQRRYPLDVDPGARCDDCNVALYLDE
jgi:Zn-finger nucleic acid-binding protein